MKRFPWFETILILVVMSISIYAALSDSQNFSWRWFTRDDAYYYFKVAQNISEGRGSTFDGVDRTNGYHPLWMLICIPIFALARFDLILPLRILLLVMSGLSVVTAILLYRLIGRVFMPAIGAIAALFWVFSQDVLKTLYQNGLESGIAAFFIVLLVYQLYELETSWRKNGVSRRQIIVLAIIAVLILFSRLDLVFLAGIAGLWIIFRGSPLRFLLPLDITAVAVMTLLAFILRVDITGYYQDVPVALAMLFLSLMVKIPGAFLAGLYEHSVLSKTGQILKRLILFSLAGALIAGGLMLVILRLGLVQGSFSRVLILMDLGLTFLFFGLSRFIYLGWRSEPSSSLAATPLEHLRVHWRKWMSEGVLYYGIVFGALGVYIVWSKWVFGTASPVSGQIKQWWASLPGRAYGGPARDLLSFFGLRYSDLSDTNAWNPVSTILGGWAERMYRLLPIIDVWRYLILLTLLAVAFYLLLLANRRKGKIALTQMSIIPLLSAAWLQMLYYSALGYASHKEWYWVTQLVIIVLTSSLVLGILYTLLRKIPYRSIIAWGLAAYVGLSLGASYWIKIRDMMPYHYWPSDTAYMDIVPLLEKYTEPGSMIGMTGGGNVGYFIHDRTIVNMDGLINSYPYFQALKSRQGGAYLQSIGLDYVLANPVILDEQPYKGQFNEYLEPLKIYYGGKQLMHYRAP